MKKIMKKKNSKRKLRVFAMGLIGLPMLMNLHHTWARVAPPPVISQTMSNDAQTLQPKLLWKKDLHANISYLSLSADGKQVLVSMSGNKKIEISPETKKKITFFGQVQKFAQNGKLLWTYRTEKPIRSQALSHDGKLALVNTYDSKFFAVDEKGKAAWKKEHYGKPVVYFDAEFERVVVLNDDDSDTKTLFTVYSMHGEELFNVPNSGKREVLDFFLSEQTVDGGQAQAPLLLVSYLTGDVDVFELSKTSLLKGKPLFSEKQKDPLLSTALRRVSPEKGELFFLSRNLKDKKLQLTQIEVDLTTGKTKKLSDIQWQEPLLDSISLISSEGKISIVGYGNTKAGQALVGFSLDSAKWQKVWEYGYDHPSPYNSLMHKLDAPELHFAAVGFEPIDSPGEMRFTALTPEGKTAWQIPLEAKDGVFGFALSKAKANLNAAIGAGKQGSGQLLFYKVK